MTDKKVGKSKLHWRPMESKIEKLVSDFGRIRLEPRFLSSREAMCDAFGQQRHPDSSAREAKSPKPGISDARICSKSKIVSLDLPIPKFGLQKTVEPELSNDSFIALIDEELSNFSNSTKYENMRIRQNKSPSPEFNGLNIDTSMTFFDENNKPDAFSSAKNLLNGLLQDVQKNKEHESCAPSPEKLHATDNHVSDMEMLAIEEQMEQNHNVTDLQEVDMVLCSITPESEEMEEDVAFESEQSSKASCHSLSEESPPLPPPRKSSPLPPLPQSPPPANEENIGVGQETNKLGTSTFEHQASSPCHRRKRCIQDNESSHHEVPNKSPRVGLDTNSYYPTCSPVSPSESSENAIPSIHSQGLQNFGSAPVRHSVPPSQYSNLPYPVSVQSAALYMGAPQHLPPPMPFPNASGYPPAWTNNANGQMPINPHLQETFLRAGPPYNSLPYSLPPHHLSPHHLSQQVFNNQFVSPPVSVPAPLALAYCQPSPQLPNSGPVPRDIQPAKESPSYMPSDQHRNLSQSQMITAEYKPAGITENSAKRNLAGNMPGKMKKRPLDSCATAFVDVLSHFKDSDLMTKRNITAQKTADAFKIDEPTASYPENDKPRNCGVFYIVHKEEFATEPEQFKTLPCRDNLINVNKLAKEVQMKLPNVMGSISEDLHSGAPSITDETNKQLNIIQEILTPFLELIQTLKDENYIASK